ncbi:hypothetical protein A9Q81_08460 [Gammaproteobacteria bacterium 42_54_T18]|nr:hypothetical protein A9Q81_08460 [Gammaproteobacteria bacterium 42_54_T18]
MTPSPDKATWPTNFIDVTQTGLIIVKAIDTNLGGNRYPIFENFNFLSLLHIDIGWAKWITLGYKQHSLAFFVL